MVLDSLLELVETLRERIDEHRGALTQSETLTRYALIDPMLRELGWDTDDPALVVPEYKSGSGSADYALLDKGKPRMMLEAKKLGTQLQDAVVQGIQYCLMEGTPYFALTDGNRWEVYRIQGGVPIADQRVVEFDLKGQSPAEVCLKALALWRPSVESGHVVAGSAPVAGQDSVGDRPPPPPPPPRDDHEWQSLSELNPQPGSEHPAEVRFPDNTTIPTTAWSAILVETVRWLMHGQYLNVKDCPIKTKDGNRRCLVNDEPIHPSRDRFVAPEQVGPLFVEKNQNTPQTVKATQFIVSRFGQDPSQFKVSFSSPSS